MQVSPGLLFTDDDDDDEDQTALLESGSSDCGVEVKRFLGAQKCFWSLLGGSVSLQAAV